MKIFNKLLILFFLKIATASALGLNLDIHAQFHKGKLKIKPTFLSIQGNSVIYEHSHTIGLSLNFAKLFNPNADKPTEDTYFFLEGNPDSLSFYILSLYCNNNKTEGVTFYTHDFQVLEGNYQVRVVPQILFGKNIIETSATLINLKQKLNQLNFCSDEFRIHYKNNKLSTLNTTEGIFNLKYKREFVYISWDPDQWIDESERRSQQVLDEAEQILSDPESR